MIKAGEYHKDKFTWGEAEQYHSVEMEDKKFNLFDVVKVLLNDGRTICGEIGYIGENSFDILPEGEPARNISFKDVKDIIM